MPGFPIRTSSDHSSVDSSPRLIAASYVLHRLLMPRHPPYALNNLLQRCSHPLCSSQTPTRTPKPTYEHQRNPEVADVPAALVLEPSPTTPTGSCLRTQQCADTYSTPAPLTFLSTLPRGCSTRTVSAPVVSYSSSSSTAYERHPMSVRHRRGSPDPSADTRAVRCSLERR